MGNRLQRRGRCRKKKKNSRCGGNYDTQQPTRTTQQWHRTFHNLVLAQQGGKGGRKDALTRFCAGSLDRVITKFEDPNNLEELLYSAR